MKSMLQICKSCQKLLHDVRVVTKTVHENVGFLTKVNVFHLILDTLAIPQKEHSFFSFLKIFCLLWGDGIVIRLPAEELQYSARLNNTLVERLPHLSHLKLRNTNCALTLRNIPFQYLISVPPGVVYYHSAGYDGRKVFHHMNVVCKQTGDTSPWRKWVSELAATAAELALWDLWLSDQAQTHHKHTLCGQRCEKQPWNASLDAGEPFAGVVGMGQRAVAVFCEGWGGGGCSEWQPACHSVTCWTQHSDLFNHVIWSALEIWWRLLRQKRWRGKGGVKY